VLKATPTDGFLDLRPSNPAGYTIRELQRAGFADGQDSLGTVNGMTEGEASLNDTISGVVLPRPSSMGGNYNFGERRLSEDGVEHGQTAAIGIWQNKNGQNLIKSLNGGPAATQQSDWLAATFPNFYGGLAGKTNSETPVSISRCLPEAQRRPLAAARRKPTLR
jgi:hypothetical protein